MAGAVSTADIRKLVSKLESVAVKLDEEILVTTSDYIKKICLDSAEVVPVWTGTLQSSLEDKLEFKVQRHATKVQAYAWYGGQGDPVNPKTGNKASEYMWAPGKDTRNWDGKYLYWAYDKHIYDYVAAINNIVANIGK